LLDGCEISTEAKDNKLEIKGLNPYTHEYKLSKICTIFGKEPKISLLREESKENSLPNFPKGTLPTELQQYANDIIFDSRSTPKQSKKYPNTYKCEIFFKTKNAALEFARNFDGKSLYGFPCCTTKVRFCMNLSLPNIIYKLYKRQLEDLLPVVLQTHDNKFKYYLGDIDDELKVGRNSISIYRKFYLDDLEMNVLSLEKEFAELQTIISQAITKDVIQVAEEDRTNAFSRAMINYYRELSREPMYEGKLYIAYNLMNHTLAVYSENPKYRESALERILGRISRLKEIDPSELIDLTDIRVSNMRSYFKRHYTNDQLD